MIDMRPCMASLPRPKTLSSLFIIEALGCQTEFFFIRFRSKASSHWDSWSQGASSLPMVGFWGGGLSNDRATLDDRMGCPLASSDLRCLGGLSFSGRSLESLYFLFRPGLPG